MQIRLGNLPLNDDIDGTLSFVGYTPGASAMVAGDARIVGLLLRGRVPERAEHGRSLEKTCAPRPAALRTMVTARANGTQGSGMRLQPRSCPGRSDASPGS